MNELLTISKTSDLNINYSGDTKLFLKWLNDTGKDLDNTNKQAFIDNVILNIDLYLRSLIKTNDFEMSTIHKKRIALKQFIMQSLGNSQYDNLLKGMIDYKFKKEVVKVKAKKPQAVYLKRHKIEKMIDTLYAENKIKTALFIKFLFFTGVRVSELCNILLSKCKIKADKVYIDIIGKGNKARSIFIPVSLYNEIISTFKGKKYLFETNTGNKYHRVNVHYFIRKAGQDILNDRIFCHLFRHSFGSYQIQDRKQDLSCISEYLGHSDTNTTTKFYLDKRSEFNDFFDINGNLK